MSSNLASALKLVWMNDYTTVVIVVAVVYDYFLTFTREVDYVWSRSWSWISTMFILVRYVGLCWAVLGGLMGSTFVPGPLKVAVCIQIFIADYVSNGCSRCTGLLLLTFWEFLIFLAVADLIMIMRVYAMWNRSPRILYFLLFVYAAQVITSFTFSGLYNNPNTYLSVSVDQIANLSFCNSSFNNLNPTSLLASYMIPRFVLSGMLLVLALFPTLKQAVGMYRATGQFQLNVYMHRLVREGILYFLANLINNVVSLLTSASVTNETWLLFLNVLCYVTVCPIMPRFIVGMRALYDRDAQGRFEGAGVSMDSGFGVGVGVAGHGDGVGVVSTIAFADNANALGSRVGDGDRGVDVDFGSGREGDAEAEEMAGGLSSEC